MASIEYRTRTARVIAYVNKQKHCFPLGKVTKKTAERFANNIDTLLHERRCNLPLSREVSNWLVDLDDTLYEMLADRRLIEQRVNVGTLATFINSYTASRGDVSERRIGKFKNAKERLLEFFGDVELQSITPGAADEYARWLLMQVASTTAHKECQIAAQFFRHAFRKELIPRNPFEGVSVGISTNDDRRMFVSRDVIAKVLDKCPSWQWRTVVALARFGGLRCSSEVALLKWSDVHWDTDRFTVHSPKTKRYGKATRIVPLFAELRPFLDEAFSMAEEGERWVIPMLGGDADKNLGTTFRKIVKRAGVEVWPKPFQNLRASRQTELEQQFPTYVVCAWMGNTPTIAHKHYLTVTDEHFDSAVAETGYSRGMHTPVSGRKDSHEKTRTVHFVRENASFSEVLGILENARVAEKGLEPPTRGL
jgi:integrase